MGMRIYNGWKFPEGTTFEQAFSVSRGLQPQMEALADRELTSTIVQLAASRIDRWFAGTMGWIDYPFDLADDSSPMGDAFMAVVDRRELVHSKGIRAADVDVEASLVIIPSQTGLYALTYCENNAMREAMVQGFGLEDFCWYDDDPPDDLDEDQWAARRTTWDQLLGDRGIPSLAGATLQIVRENHMTPRPMKEDTLDQSSMPTLKKRANEIAMDAPQSKLHEARNTTEVRRAMERLRENPPEEFVALREVIEATLPGIIPHEWFFMKKPELLAVWEAQALALSTKPTDATRSGPRF